uniref:Uncharacterized protein n=1 Tax=Anguilla anguilla TaxID=7936 RepID=A0A0E9WGP2_ANGAN
MKRTAPIVECLYCYIQFLHLFSSLCNSRVHIKNDVELGGGLIQLCRILKNLSLSQWWGGLMGRMAG